MSNEKSKVLYVHVDKYTVLSICRNLISAYHSWKSISRLTVYCHRNHHVTIVYHHIEYHMDITYHHPMVILYCYRPSLH